MSQALQEIDQLLSASDFYERLLMFKVAGPAARLDAQDWEDIRRLWLDRSVRWRGDFQWVVCRAEHPAVVPFVFDLLRSEEPARAAEGYHLFLNMDMTPGWERIGAGEWNTLVGVCRRNPQWRGPLETIAWRMGKLIEFRRLLGNDSSSAAA